MLPMLIRKIIQDEDECGKLLQEVTDVFIWDPRGWVNWNVGVVTPGYFGFKCDQHGWYTRRDWWNVAKATITLMSKRNWWHDVYELMYVGFSIDETNGYCVMWTDIVNQGIWWLFAKNFAAMAWKEWDCIPWDKCWHLLISYYALLIVLSTVIKFCTHVIEKSCITCGGNAGDKGNRCGSCERLGNIEDDVLSRGSVCNIPQLVRLLSRNFLFCT